MIIFLCRMKLHNVFQFFSDTGKYIKRIGHRGEGPTEYSSIGDFVVNEDYIYIQDLYKNKVLRYGLKDNSVETLLLKRLLYG